MTKTKSTTRKSANAKNRRRNTQATNRQFLVVVVCFAIFGFCAMTLFPQVRGYLTSSSRLTQQQLAYEQALNRQATLEIELKKAQDPNYIQQYAREKYFLSHDGEILLVLPNPPQVEVVAEAGSIWEQIMKAFQRSEVGE